MNMRNDTEMYITDRLITWLAMFTVSNLCAISVLVPVRSMYIVAISPAPITTPKMRESMLARLWPSFLYITMPLCIRNIGTRSRPAPVTRSSALTVPVSSRSPIAASAATVKKSAQNRKQQFLYLLLSFVKDMISSIHQQTAMIVSKSSIDFIC